MKEKERKNGKTGKDKKNADRIFTVGIVALCILMAVFEFAPVRYCKDEIKNKLLSDTVPLLIGSVAVVLLMLRGKSKLFCAPAALPCLLPCLLVAIDNFPFHAYFSGKSELLFPSAGNIALFAGYCLMVGVFEECVFRGVLFPVLAGYFPPDKKGVLKTFFCSSVLFGASHLFNLFAGAGIGATVLQVGYSTLTGGLFAFALMKSKSIFPCILLHGVYDFCGLLLDTLGNGVRFDWQTCVTMAAIGVAVGVFVLCSVFTYPESEREELYRKFGLGVKPTNGGEPEKEGDGRD